MYNYITNCIVCDNEIKIALRTKKEETNLSEYCILNKTENGLYKCEILEKCNKCKITHKEIRDIELDKYI